MTYSLKKTIIALSMAALPASGSAQGGSGEFWLQCNFKESFVRGTVSEGPGFDYLSVSPNSVIGYYKNRPSEGEGVSLAGNLCEWDHGESGTAECRITSDEIYAHYFPPDRNIRITINRRSGTFEWWLAGSSNSPAFATGSGDCRRVEDPRPPAAF